VGDRPTHQTAGLFVALFTNYKRMAGRGLRSSVQMSIPLICCKAGVDCQDIKQSLFTISEY